MGKRMGKKRAGTFMDARAGRPTAKRPKKVKRLNLTVSQATYNELLEIAEAKGITMTDVMRTAFGLFVVASDEKAEGKQLAITKDGKVEKELVFLRG